MKLFLDSSVLLAAAGSATGASRFVVDNAAPQDWTLLTAAYCIEEAQRNTWRVGPNAAEVLGGIIVPRLTVVPTELAFDKALVFPKAKDRPVLLSALGAKADHLLTLDEADFQKVSGSKVYGMEVSTPGRFLINQREADRL